MNMHEYGSERHSHISCFDSLYRTALLPSVRREYATLFRHDSNSAYHTMRVTYAMVTASHQIGLNPHLAAVCGISHDFGKSDVDPTDLQTIYPDPAMVARIRTTHMDGTRRRIHAIPDYEISQTAKHMILAVVMAHHEILGNANGHSPYPRKEHIPLPHHIVRKHTPHLENMQLLLALCDTADRLAYGFYGAKRTPESDVQQLLGSVLQEATHQPETDLVHRYIHITAHTIVTIPEFAPQHAVDIFTKIQ